MQVLSSISSLGVTVRGYDDAVLAELLREEKPDKIFLTEIAEHDFEQNNTNLVTYERVRAVVDAEIIAVGVDMDRFNTFRDNFLRENVNTPELSIKKNMLDLIDNTITNYLAQYWKGHETINSEVTDSLFRAKHKLFSSVFYGLEAEFWENRNREVLDNIKKRGVTKNSVIISSVESRFWFKDHMSELLA